MKNNNKESTRYWSDLMEKSVCKALGISLFEFFNSTEFYGKDVSDKPYKIVLEDYFNDEEIREKYEILGYDHAGDILKCYPEEFDEIKSVLKNLEIEMQDVIVSGGNESVIPKKIRKKYLKFSYYFLKKQCIRILSANVYKLVSI